MQSMIDDLTWEKLSSKEKVGQGSFAVTYSCIIEGRKLALKVFHSSHTDRARWENECWALETLTHDSIPKLYGRGSISEPNGSGESLYILMKFFEGPTLRKLLDEHALARQRIGEVNLLVMLQSLFDVLAYCHEHGVVHRDIKPDNIIVNPLTFGTSIIDFGLCNAPNRPVDARSINRVGAVRYCPPDKISNPHSKNELDDIFAVGVTAYKTLTEEYPWKIREEDEDGEIIRTMTTKRPVALHTRYRAITPGLPEFIHRLIEIDEVKRGSARQNFGDAQTLIDLTPETQGRTAWSRDHELTFPRVTLDPIHGDIRMTDFEWEVLDSPEFQRLRYMRQLGFANMVYLGAEHSRMNHSLGTMHVADRILRTIKKSHDEPLWDDNFTESEMRQMIRLYALVHDVTHIPFGHTLEDELGFFERHDSNQPRIERLLSDDSTLGKKLRTHEIGRRVLEHLLPDASIRRQTYLVEMITSPYGADVLDYIDRDSYFCGLDHRVDQSIFRRFHIVFENDGGKFLMQNFGKHGRRLDSQFALEELPTQRYALFMKVYSHSRKTAACAMLGKALCDVLYKKKPVINEAMIENMGDDELLFSLHEKGTDSVKCLIKAITRRILYKPVFVGDPLGGAEAALVSIEGASRDLSNKGIMKPESRRELEVKLARKAGLAPEQVICYCPPKPPGYGRQFYYSRETPDGKGTKQVVSERHEGLTRKHASLWKLMVFAPPDIAPAARSKLAEAASEEFEKPNEIAESAMQQMLRI